VIDAVQLDPRGRRLRAALAAVLVRDNQPELKLMRDWLDLVGPGANRRRVRLSNFEGQEDVGKEIEGTRLSR
jgi:hypothetical protein